MNKTIVHIIPSGVFSNSYHGSYKDTISRVSFLRDSGANYIQILLDEDSPLAAHASIPDSKSIAFLVEYSTMPKVVQSIRSRFPDAFIAVRSHNLEPMQHFDNHGLRPKGKGLPWLFYGMSRLAWGDIVIKRCASVLWSISEWENRVYWKRLPGRAIVEWMPYCCPSHLLHEPIAPNDVRPNIVCMPTSQKNRKSWDLVVRFITFADEMKRHTGNKYNYLITGNVANWELPSSDAVVYAGMMDDMKCLLSTTKAVALLSGKGYGFKTTIGDAIANGALALVHPVLAKRYSGIMDCAMLPVDIKRWSVSAVTQKLDSFKSQHFLNQKFKAASELLLSQLVKDT